MRAYVSCGCGPCKNWPPSHIKGRHKRKAHRELRRKTKNAIRNMDEDNDPIIPQSISTGRIA